MGRLASLYLFAYNAAQACGWTIALIKLILTVSSTNSFDGAYAACGELICIVPSRVLPVLMQWGGRFHFVAAIISQIPEFQLGPYYCGFGAVLLVITDTGLVQKLPAVFITFMSWSLSEVIRYPQYALNTIELCPGWLTWLRYSAFIVLYPIGALIGEMPAMYKALPYIKKKNIYGDAFNKLPFSYYSFIVAVLVCYPFLWLKLYMYMFKQRKSKLGKRGESKKALRPKIRVE
ncbi:uncharacterized protein LOC131046438 isoform X2 [Cryptomeria japonica]|uniref:uncharacterized protein LOC131046438 isoform X2 n=1 Tax=Cryptomeria japonica TaxID=3369 RepID=UPI0027DA4E66|nr:uncharacterized protein LOC131046438 isoform X2 [Cryptomeria japonica]